MELKRNFDFLLMFPQKLLIVPYGIETCLSLLRNISAVLLIVPYGIETYVMIVFNSIGVNF